MWGIKEINAQKLGVWLCDFSGKGIRASMNTFRLHTLIHELNDDILCHPDLFMAKLNSHLKSFMPPGNFATFLYGVIDLELNTFQYSAASSTAPIIYQHQAAERYEAGDSSGLSLGIIDNATYTLHSMDFKPGHSLMLYSDLLWESPDVSGICFDEENRDYFFRSMPKDELIYHLLKENIQENDSYSDDLTFIEIHRQSDWPS